MDSAAPPAATNDVAPIVFIEFAAAENVWKARRVILLTVFPPKSTETVILAP